MQKEKEFFKEFYDVQTAIYWHLRHLRRRPLDFDLPLVRLVSVPHFSCSANTKKVDTTVAADVAVAADRPDLNKPPQRVCHFIKIRSVVDVTWISINFIPIDSSLNSLQNVFWSRRDWVKRLNANSRQWRESRANFSSLGSFSAYFHSNVFSDRIRLKRLLIDNSKGYLTVYKFIKFDCKLSKLNQIKTWHVSKPTLTYFEWFSAV